MPSADSVDGNEVLFPIACSRFARCPRLLQLTWGSLLRFLCFGSRPHKGGGNTNVVVCVSILSAVTL